MLAIFLKLSYYLKWLAHMEFMERCRRDQIQLLEYYQQYRPTEKDFLQSQDIRAYSSETVESQ